MKPYKKPWTPKVGDLCTSYYKGIWKLEDIDYTDGRSSFGLASLVKVLNSNYDKASSVRKTCDIFYCKKLTKEELLEKAQKTHNSLVDKLQNNLD